MKVLYCAYEVAPFFKKGGLGDVAGSLPKALARLGVDIRVVMPEYNIKYQISNIKNTNQIFKIEYAEKEEQVEIWESVLPGSGVPIYFLENEKYLNQLKGRQEKLEQFAFFSKAITEFTRYRLHVAGYKTDLVHLNDWHTALVALLLRLRSVPRPAIVLTVHNFSYQGIVPLDVLSKLGLSKQASRVLEWDTSDQNLEMLMQGIIYSDIVNTVSPKYSKEILDPGFIGRLSQVLKGKEARVKGILNGIDYDVWNPETDRNIKANYGLKNQERFDPPPPCGGKHPRSLGGFASGSDLSTTEAILGGLSTPQSGVFPAGPTLRGSSTLSWQEGKKANKLALQKELGLEINEKTPLLSSIGRLASHQKGLDILHQALVDLEKKEEFQFVLLGKGSREWEEKFKKLEDDVPKKSGRTSLAHIRVLARFDETLAHRIYAGADFILIPSKFEPCGLIQMIAMKYGTLPIVRKTGGLADTVQDEINGFLFEQYSVEALSECVERAIKKRKIQSAKFKAMIRRAMSEDFSWKRSAKEYLTLYEKAIEIKERN